MSLRPHPKNSVLCSATVSVTVIPWVDGRRRPEAKYRRVCHCDRWHGHEAKGLPHLCRDTAEIWFERAGDAWDWQLRGGDGHG